MNILYTTLTLITLSLAPPASAERGNIELKLSKDSTAITYILFYTNHADLKEHHSLGVLGQPHPKLSFSNLHTNVLVVYGHNQTACRDGTATAIRLEPSKSYTAKLNRDCQLTMEVD